MCRARGSSGSSSSSSKGRRGQGMARKSERQAQAARGNAISVGQVKASRARDLPSAQWRASWGRRVLSSWVGGAGESEEQGDKMVAAGKAGASGDKNLFRRTREWDGVGVLFPCFCNENFVGAGSAPPKGRESIEGARDRSRAETDAGRALRFPLQKGVGAEIISDKERTVFLENVRASQLLALPVLWRIAYCLDFSTRASHFHWLGAISCFLGTGVEEISGMRGYMKHLKHQFCPLVSPSSRCKKQKEKNSLTLSPIHCGINTRSLLYPMVCSCCQNDVCEKNEFFLFKHLYWVGRD
ncbi:uncharacterized protein LOC112540626 [Python bivittatus]|uniref:Uncharacterized protein LOC112540626 n=1 Tax=Python bivittatus TaxID=176946 RepID=A0A9F5MSK0_PYTBI|nr:uncharacterized protein LOC112540626 [Python bivittatus]